MLKNVACAALVAAFSLVSLDSGIATYDSKDYTFEITEETDFGRYDESSTNNTFKLPLTIGNAYDKYTFSCEAFIYSPRPDGTYDSYPDNGDMVSEPLYVKMPVGYTTGCFTATFITSFFGNTTYCAQWTDILLVFQLVGTSSTIGSDKYTFTFYTRSIQIGYGEYTIEPGTKEFYPYDDHIVFGGNRPNDNCTEMVDFSKTKDAICEEKYLSLNDDFEVTFTAYDPNDNDTWGDPNFSRASICVKDPEYYFPYMHGVGNPNFQISLINLTSSGVKDHSKPLTATFEVGGETYWVETHTLEMSRTQMFNYEETTNFYFKCGYFEEIKENCEFYLRMERVGHNEATYNVKLDFLGDHDYYGSCLTSDYCMHSGRG